MCGTGDINVQDFKAHAVIVGGSWHFREKVSRRIFFSVFRMFECVYLLLLQVMKWFWAVVSSFTQEELARLLQFTTGSSQLPPGGFNTLCPSFQIIAAPTHSTLPTAHTWSVRKHRLMYRFKCLMRWTQQVTISIFPTEKHPLDGLTETFCWDVHSSHVGILFDFWWTLDFYSRVNISQGNSRSKSGLGSNFSWCRDTPSVLLDLTHCFKIALNYLQIMGCTFY